MTHSRWQGGRLARALAAALMLAGAITAIGVARAPATSPRQEKEPDNAATTVSPTARQGGCRLGHHGRGRCRNLLGGSTGGGHPLRGRRAVRGMDRGGAALGPGWDQPEQHPLGRGRAVAV